MHEEYVFVLDGSRPLADVLPPAHKAQVEQALRRVEETGRSYAEQYVTANCRSHFELIVAPTGAHAFTVVLRNVTGRVALQEQLRQTQKMDAVSQLTDGLAYEFTNILNVIRANAELLASDAGRSGPELGQLRGILAATHLGATIVGQLMGFSRRGMLHRERVEVRAAVSSFLPILRRMLSGHIRVEAGAMDTDAVALIDLGALEHSLAHLCTNACDAMPAGGTIRVDCRPARLDAGCTESHPSMHAVPYVSVSVSDTGVGMDARTRERIFEPFFTTKPAGAGAGLGLAMVYGAMRDHCGMIRVQSEVGRGTVVELLYPVEPTR